MPGIKRIYNEAFTDIWGYYPVDDAEIGLIADRLIAIADPRLIKLVMVGEQVAGFILAYPDISAGLQRARGRLWPFGWWHLQRALKTTPYLSFNGIGLLPQYQGLGATAVLYAELAAIADDERWEHADLAQVAETNIKSLAETRAVGAEWYKRHRVYRRGV